MNTTVCDQVDRGADAVVEPWMSPMRTPPRTAPVRLPMPPRTAAVEHDQARAALAQVERHGADRLLVHDAGRRASTPPRAKVDDPVDIDPHQPGGVLVLRGGAHRLALPDSLPPDRSSTTRVGMVNTSTMRKIPRSGCIPDGDAAVRRHAGVLLGGRAVERQADLLEDEAAMPTAVISGASFGRVAQPPVGEELMTTLMVAAGAAITQSVASRSTRPSRTALRALLRDDDDEAE